jgi:hypothetical protein
MPYAASPPHPAYSPPPQDESPRGFAMNPARAARLAAADRGGAGQDGGYGGGPPQGHMQGPPGGYRGRGGGGPPRGMMPRGGGYGRGGW